MEEKSCCAVLCCADQCPPSSEVDNPFKLSLRDLLADYEQLTCPITLVCAGNRRKEQNVVRKSKGFSWGPAGLATALFTGCMMADVIRSARPRRGARFVCMEGADKLVCRFLFLLLLFLRRCLDVVLMIRVARFQGERLEEGMR